MSSSDLPKLQTTSSKFEKFILSKSLCGIKNQPNLSDFLKRTFDKEINFYKSNFLKTLIYKVHCSLKMCPIFFDFLCDFGKIVHAMK